MRWLFLICFVFAGAVHAAPEMDLQRGISIADAGSDNVSGGDAGVPTTVGYVIANTGTTALTIGAISFSGQTNCNVVATLVPATVAAGATAELRLEVTPIASSGYSFTFDIANDDADENPYSVAVGGTCGGGMAGCYAGPPPEPWACVAGNGVGLPLALGMVGALALVRRRRTA